VGNLAATDGTHLRREKRDHGNRFAIQCDKLDLVALAAVMRQHNCAKIATFQAMFWHINRQHNTL